MKFRFLMISLGAAALQLAAGEWVLDSRTKVDTPPPHCGEAAEILRDGLKQCLTGTDSGKALLIQLEKKQLPGMDSEGFRIDFPAPATVRITGATPLAVRHGSCVFLERYLGVRWLFPGPAGTVMPKQAKVELDGKPVVQNPSYLIRTYAFTHSHKQDYAWAARNRGTFNYDFTILPDRPWFQHNLCNLLPQEIYAKTNPEFFPIRDGKRFLPAKGDNIWWQYCFTAPGIAEAFAKSVQGIFERHPLVRTVSLGVNDGARYCECANCRKMDGKLRTSLGEENHTASYLACMNKVARLCAAPGRTFGFLAYSAALEPAPGIEMESSLVPFLTFERLYWADPKRAAEDRRISSAWLKFARCMGWYDYLRFDKFLIPKVSLKAMPEALRWGAANRVKYYYAEAYPEPDCPSGPMLWMLLRLTWDPSLSVDALLQDWCSAAVGKKAAPALMDYYRLCSDFWENDVSKTPYFRDPSRQYLDISTGAYLSALKPGTLEKMKAKLQEVQRLAESAAPEEKARAAMLLKGFLAREPKIRNYIKNDQLQKQLGQLKFTKIASFDFNKPGMWSTWQRGTSHGTFHHSAKGGVDNSGALEMDAVNSFKDMVFMRNIPVKPGKVYRVSVKVRTIGTAGTAKVRLSIGWGAPGKSWLDPAYNKSTELGEDGSFSWRPLSVAFQAPDVPGCYMRCMLCMADTRQGKVYFDDVLVEEAL